MGVSSMCIFRLYYFSNGWFNYGIYNKIVMGILALEMPVALKLIIKLISFGSKYLIQRNRIINAVIAIIHCIHNKQTIYP